MWNEERGLSCSTVLLFHVFHKEFLHCVRVQIHFRTKVCHNLCPRLIFRRITLLLLSQHFILFPQCLSPKTASHFQSKSQYVILDNNFNEWVSIQMRGMSMAVTFNSTRALNTTYVLHALLNTPLLKPAYCKEIDKFHVEQSVAMHVQFRGVTLKW